MVFPARQSVGAVLLMLLVGDLFAVGYYRRYTQWSKLWGLFPAVAVGERNVGGALVLLDELVDGGMDEAQLVSQLYGYWISLWLARTGGGGGSRGYGGGSYGRLWSSRGQLVELSAGRTSREYARGVGRFYRADVDIRRGMPPGPTVGILVYELTSGAR